MLRQSQLFIKVSKDGYVPVDDPVKGQQMYTWDDSSNKIVPINKTTQN